MTLYRMYGQIYVSVYFDLFNHKLVNIHTNTHFWTSEPNSIDPIDTSDLSERERQQYALWMMKHAQDW